MNTRSLRINNIKLKDGFKYIPQYEGLYSIDVDGNIYSHRSGVFMKPHISCWGYLMVQLYKNGKYKGETVHRLVALTFIPNPENKSEVDHIDTNRLNNNVQNLRWCTTKENCNNPLTVKHNGDCRRGEKHYNFGKHLSIETKKKMSASLKGHPTSIETKIKIGNANRGHIMSDEQKKMISAFMKGKNIGDKNPNSTQVKQYDKNMNLIKTWNSIADVTRELGISASAICNCKKGKSKTAGGFVWR